MLVNCRRLLSTDPEAAKEVVLAEKPVIADTSSNLEPALLDVLLANLSTLSSVYHKPPEVRPVICIQAEHCSAAMQQETGLGKHEYMSYYNRRTDTAAATW